jgi:hypothetical protein
VAVVVNQDLVVLLVGSHDESAVAMRAKADRRADDAIPGRAHDGQPEPGDAVAGSGARPRRAALDRKSEGREAAGGEERPAMHAAA